MIRNSETPQSAKTRSAASLVISPIATGEAPGLDRISARSKCRAVLVVEEHPSEHVIVRAATTSGSPSAVEVGLAR